ncbi:cobalamin biosynthesis protein [Enemella evansiae]|nr:cobalamin biosynthesis protein [Enemella evansiae]
MHPAVHQSPLRHRLDGLLGGELLFRPVWIGHTSTVGPAAPHRHRPRGVIAPYTDAVPLPALLLGWLADEALGDPRRGHPVAGFGRLAQRLERRCWRDTRAAGVAYEILLVGGTIGAAVWLDRVTRATALRLPVRIAATWLVLGGRSLRREAAAVDELLAADELPAARERIRSLVGRDPSTLGPDELARAAIESVAENTGDAVVAPLFWGAVAGLPGLLGYRAINTLDAMVGHRSDRYRRFGWAAARVDDLANWLPARCCAGLAVLLAPVVGGSPARALRTIRRDAHQHPSPNAGPIEAVFAGALGVRLGGRNSYAGQVEDRGQLGDGPPPRRTDIARANRLAFAVAAAAALLAGATRLK